MSPVAATPPLLFLLSAVTLWSDQRDSQLAEWGSDARWTVFG